MEVIDAGESNIGFAGEMRAKNVALFLAEAAFTAHSEDNGLDTGPTFFGGIKQPTCISFR